MGSCLKNKPTPILDSTIEAQGVDKLKEYRAAGVVLQDAGGGLMSESGAQAILPDGTVTPIFRKGSNTAEKVNLLNYLETYHSNILEDGADDLGVDQTTVTTDPDTGDVTVSVETVNGETGQKTFENADLETITGLNEAIDNLQAEIDALKGEQATAQLEAIEAGQAELTESELEETLEAGADLIADADSEAAKAAAAAIEAAGDKPITTAGAATSFGEIDVLSEGDSTLLDPDIITLNPAAPVGITSVVYKTIAEREPTEAIQFQEQIAREELRRARVDRAIQKRSLMRRRLEVATQVGAGRIIRSGEEIDLDVGEPTAPITRATGLRGGRGRGSLITGSRGGIGFYSRFS